MKIKSFAMSLIMFIFISLLHTSYAAPLTVERQTEINDRFNAIWVATVLNLDYPAKPTTDSKVLKEEALSIIEEAHAMGINAIILQVRPSADAFYKSSIYPWSKYLTGKQGTAPSDGFDPLEFWIEEAHKRGIAIHAWVNPYRITRKTSTEPSHDYASLAPNHPAKLNPSWVVEHTDGNLYFNPGVPEVIEHIANSVLEIVEKYDVDGIHFDDYFYPATTFNDASAFAKYGQSYKSIADWRRSNVDQLVNRVYEVIKNQDKTVAFGISPFGIWANQKKNPLGSETNGFESYYSQYADTKKWVENNMIDYIAPQIYWNIGFDVADYKILVDWWNRVAQDSKVKLYIGHAAYRVDNKDPKSPWYGVTEIERQLSLNRNYPNIKGSIFFRYGFFKNHVDLKSIVKDFSNEKVPLYEQDQLIIGRPYKDASTTSSHYFIGGASDPKKPLYLNGQELTSRTSQGYFGVYVTLKTGVNRFTITQNEKSYTRTITRTAPLLAPPMSKIEIIPSSAWPQSVRTYQNNASITFSCRAPIGATVTVTLDGKSYQLNPATKTSNSTKPYATTFSLKTTLPFVTGTPRVVNLGKPVYKMSYKGVNYVQAANGDVKIAMESSPYMATINKDFVDSYQTAATTGGAHYILHKGMKDYVTAEVGDFVKLSSNLWVKRENLKIDNAYLRKNTVRRMNYFITDKADEIHFIISENVIKSASYNSGVLRVTFNQTSSGVDFIQPENSMILSTNKILGPSEITYEFVLKDPLMLGGYYLEDITGGIKLVMRKRFVADSKNLEQPLSGSTIMLDPGHGGRDNGAIGLLGLLKPEKKIVDDYTAVIKAKLEALGATVVLSRVGDEYVNLSDRLALSRKILPDLLVSIHADSFVDSADLSKISGFTIFYKDLLAKPIAEQFRDDIANKLLRRNRGAKVMNLYMTRSTWTPSVLVEVGFVSNPSEFQWLNDSYEQERFSSTFVDTIVNYFSRK